MKLSKEDINAIAAEVTKQVMKQLLPILGQDTTTFYGQEGISAKRQAEISAQAKKTLEEIHARQSRRKLPAPEQIKKKNKIV